MLVKNIWRKQKQNASTLAITLASLVAEPVPIRLESPTLLLSAERWGHAHPASDLVPIPQSLIIFIFNFSNMFIYTNSNSNAKFTFIYNL
jgi:hypothetical protein